MAGMATNPAWQYKNITSTTTIKSTDGQLGAIFVASTTSGTIKVQDGSATIINTFTPTVGWWPMACGFGTSLVVTLTGTIDCTVMYL
jgi:hypothetical protein